MGESLGCVLYVRMPSGASKPGENGKVSPWPESGLSLTTFWSRRDQVCCVCGPHQGWGEGDKGLESIEKRSLGIRKRGWGWRTKLQFQRLYSLYFDLCPSHYILQFPSIQYDSFPLLHIQYMYTRVCVYACVYLPNIDEGMCDFTGCLLPLARVGRYSQNCMVTEVTESRDKYNHAWFISQF